MLLVLVGVALRCVAINQPPIDAHLIRQCQTALVTKTLISEPGLHVSARIPWRGESDARYVLELPIYNYLVIAFQTAIRNLNASGKVVSIILWACGFLLLQSIWRRCLSTPETFWANLLFVLAPLSVFYGQAFMPEMLVQFLAFAFVLLSIRYSEGPTLGRWTACAGVGLIGLLLKLPEIAHLYLLLTILLLGREKWKALTRPRYWIAAIATVVIVQLWSSYLSSTNASHLPEWTSQGNIHNFMGTWSDRIHLKPWASVFAYLAALLVPGAALLASAYGLYVWSRKKEAGILGAWLASLLLFYLAWLGNAGPAGQSYYNLPALAPLCALFGIGICGLLQSSALRSRQSLAAVSISILLLLSVAPGWRYLFNQDRQIAAATLWAKENTDPGDIILFRLNHRRDMTNYPNNPVPAYLSERRTFIAAGSVTSDALDNSSYAIVTLPPQTTTGWLSVLERLRHRNPLPPESGEWLENAGFHRVARQPGFDVYKKN